MSLGVAVVGLGVGEEHVRAFLETGLCRILRLCDFDRARAQALAVTLGDGSTEASFDQVLADDEVRIVSIASFDQAHAAQVLAALNAGKHVFVEKPLCRSLEELSRIRDAWAAHDGRIKLASNFVLRAAPLYRWLKDSVEKGDFGRLYAFDGDYLYGRIEKITRGWRKDVVDYSVMLGGGIHLVDLMRWITAERPLEAWSSGNRICTEGTAFRHDDYSAATLRSPSGLIGRITANFGCVHPHQHVLRVFGTRATFIYDDEGPRVCREREASRPAAVDLASLPPSKGVLIPAFVAAVLEDRDLRTQTQEVLDVVSICVACDAALRSGAVEKVRYV